MPRRRSKAASRKSASKKKSVARKKAIDQAARTVLQTAEQQQQIQENAIITAALRFHEERLFKERFSKEHPDMVDILESSNTAQELFKKIIQTKVPAPGSSWDMYSPEAQRAAKLDVVLRKD